MRRKPSSGLLWDWYGAHAEESAAFTGAMDNLAAQVAGEVTRAIDFSRVGRVVDVGGANGTLVSAVPRAFPVISEDGRPSPAHLMDVNMLVLLAGKERTATEYGALFAAAGLRLAQVHPTHSPFSIVEGIKD